MTTYDRIAYTTLRIAFNKATVDLDENSDKYKKIAAATKDTFKEITGYNGTFRHVKTATEKEAPTYSIRKGKTINWQDIDDDYVYTLDISLGRGFYPVKEKKNGIVTLAVNDEGESRWINTDDASLLRANKIPYKL